MGAYKQFNSQDIIITPFEVNKTFSFKGNELIDSDVGIDRYIGRNGDFLTNKTLTGKIPGQQEYEVLVYNSVKQLYFSNYISSSQYGYTSNASTASFNPDGTITGPTYQPNFYNYEQNTIFSRKYFPTGSDITIGISSIPSKLYGDYIQPNSFNLKTNDSGSIRDDGQGRLYLDLNDPENPSDPNNKSYIGGNIIYQHGLIVVTDDTAPGNPNIPSLYGEGTYGRSVYGRIKANKKFIENFFSSNEVTCSFSSSYELFETQYKTTINPSEYNYSQNPTVLSGSQGDLYPHFTGSYFSPYITTVGLYNEDYELLAIGKLAKPLPTSRTTDTTILINIDR